MNENKELALTLNLSETKHELAAKSLERYINAGQNRMPYEKIAHDITGAVIGELSGDTAGLDALLVKQALVLDSAFDHVIVESQGKQTSEHTMKLALKIQEQAARTIKTLRALKRERHIKNHTSTT